MNKKQSRANNRIKKQRAKTIATRGSLIKRPSNKKYSRANRKEYNKRYRTTDKGWAIYYFGRKAQACRSLVPGSTIRSADLQELYKFQQGKCALTNVELRLGGEHHPNCLSIDRIDPNKPYTRENIRLITWQSNSARMRGTDAELVDFCQLILQNFGFTIVSP